MKKVLVSMALGIAIVAVTPSLAQVGGAGGSADALESSRQSSTAPRAQLSWQDRMDGLLARAEVSASEEPANAESAPAPSVPDEMCPIASRKAEADGEDDR